MPSKRMQTLLKQLAEHGIQDQNVLQAIAAVPREHFIDEALSHQAYDNTALPIGAGQTISQPYTVAKMTELLELTPESKVLEIGTGSGYQTAVLAHIVSYVYSVERIKSLQWQAKRRLKQLDMHNVSTRHGDGWEGWKIRGPFDAIIVTAAAGKIPNALINQLADGARMVLPVGEQNQSQSLQLVRRVGDDCVVNTVGPAHFVPLIKGVLA